MKELPLSDIRVVDLTVARAGPTAVRQLADWGADVVHVEPAGRSERGFNAARLTPDHLNLHRDKRAITLDLKQPHGLEVFFDLARRADVLVENFRAPVKRRLGIDYEAVRRVNRRIIYGSISGFGQDGPYADRAGVDQIAQGLGGLMSVTGLPGQGPVRVGIPISDLAAGMYLAIGILVAIHERERSGEGQWVHTSLLEAQIAMLDFQAARWLIGSEVPPQAGNHHPTGIPMGMFPSADGYVNIAASTNRAFRTFCGVIGAETLAEREEYATPPARHRNRDALNAEIADRLKARTTAEWVEALNAVGIPCGPVCTIDQTMSDPQVEHLGIAQPVEHPTEGRIEVVGQPVHLTRTPTLVRRPAPGRGEHTDEVLRELGYDDARIAGLREENVID